MPHQSAGLSPGQHLSRRFHTEVVGPSLAAAVPAVPYAAALVGRGSEVLGYDDELSRDHDWRARVTVFLPETAADDQHRAVTAALAEVPAEFLGQPTAVGVTTVEAWFRRELALELNQDWDVVDWVTLPGSKLCAMTSAVVHHDAVGLTAAIDRVRWYPEDVWRFLLAAAWWRVHPEANLVGRTGAVGDDLGSALLTADMVSGLMRLAFLVERVHPPYVKWFGTAFSRLDLASRLAPHLTAALGGTNGQEREAALGKAYSVVGEACNDLALAPRQTLTDCRLWERPWSVPWADFPTVLRESVTDPAVHDLFVRWPVGVIDRIPDLLPIPRAREAIRRFALQ